MLGMIRWRREESEQGMLGIDQITGQKCDWRHIEYIYYL